MTEKKLSEIIKTLQLIRKLIKMDLYLAVFDENAIVKYCYPETGEKDGIVIGKKFQDPTGRLQMALRTGREIFNRIPSGKMGFELEGNLVPVMEDGKVTGCISTTYIPMNQQALAAQQIALQATYYLIVNVNLQIDKCIELYKSFDPEKFHLQFTHYSQFLRQLGTLIHPEDQEAFQLILQTEKYQKLLKERSFFSCEARLLQKKEEYKWSEFLITKVSKERKQSEEYLFMIRDIHERKSMEEKMNREKYALIQQLKEANEALFEREMHDGLTGILNRKGLDYYQEAYIKKILEKEYLLFLCEVDLNNLKQINDFYGHQMGDVSIINMARQIENSLLPDMICARSGGDEYWILGCYEKETNMPRTYLERLHENVRKYNEQATVSCLLEYSYGFYSGPVEAEKDLAFYYRYADEQMYIMKKEMRQRKQR